MKTIVPKSPVTAESGISAAVNVLDRISDTIIKIPPIAMHTGIDFLVFLPTSSLAMCGMTSPIHETVPQKATVIAVSRVDINMMTVR